MRRLVLLLISVLLATPAFAADALRYVVLVDGGTQAGHLAVAPVDAEGVVRSEFIFKDNGRGPELTEEYVLAADGSFSRYQVTGTSTFGAPVDETFRIEDGKAVWKSLSDAGEQPARAGAMYSPLSGAPQSFSVMIAALARNPETGVPLIPGGTLKARAVDSLEVSSGGRRQVVELLAITGVGFTPQFVWATTGDSPRLFAFIYPGWMQMIEDGWQADAATLEARQKTAEAQALVDLQRRLGHGIPGATLVRNVRVFDSEHATLGDATSVLVDGGRIVAVGDDAGEGTGAARPVARVLDGGGRVLLPGLMDAHAHVDRWSGALNIAAGVTTARDMGNDNATLQQIIAEEQGGTLLGPRIVPAGFLEGESPMSARNGFVVKDLAGAREAVDWYAAHDYPQLKIYNSFPRDILRETVAYAHAKGMRVSGHVPVHLRAQDAIDAGYDEIQHINQVLLNFLVTPETDTRTLERFYLPARGVADLDFDGKPVQDFIAALAAKPVVVDPTLTAFDFLRHRAGTLSPAHAAIAEHMPPDVRRGFLAAEFDIPDDATAQRYEQSYAKMIEFVGRLYRAGVPIVAGTDDMAGFALQRELELYVQAGMTPAQALQTATWTNARYAGVQGDRGAITPGRRADLVLVDGDPTANIGDIRKIVAVIKGETLYYPADIHAEMGIVPFAQPVRVQDAAQ